MTSIASKSVVFLILLLSSMSAYAAPAVVIHWIPPGGSGRGTITLTVNGYSTNVHYGELSTAASLANHFGGLLSQDSASPVWAKGNPDGSITMMARSGQTITAITSTFTPESGSLPGGLSIDTSPGNVAPPTSTAPQISGLSPSHALFGTQVTISGSGFGTASVGQVVLSGETMEVVSYSANAITVRIRNSDISGTLVVNVNGVASNPVSFTVDTPPLCIVGFPS